MVEPFKSRRRQYGLFQTGWGNSLHRRGIGGDTVTKTRWKLEKSCLPQEKFLEKDRSYNCGHGKRAEGKQDGGVAHSSNEVW